MHIFNPDTGRNLSLGDDDGGAVSVQAAPGRADAAATRAAASEAAAPEAAATRAAASEAAAPEAAATRAAASEAAESGDAEAVPGQAGPAGEAT
jgi:hypothetical protein